MPVGTGDRVPAFVSGMVAAVPGHGGATWAVLQYVHGLRRLGYDPILVEPVASAPIPAAVRSYFSTVCASEDLVGRAALLAEDGRTVGMRRRELLDLAARAPVLINLAGTLRDPELLSRIPVRVYVDLDPAFTQLWQSVDGIDMGLGGHTHFASVGLDVGRPGCDVPTLGVRWIPTLPPVALDRWPLAGAPACDAWTTIANWRGYGSIEHEGRHYGQKAHAFREVIDLPARTDARLSVALAIHPEEHPDLDALERNRWTLVDPADVASTPDRYRRFVSSSYGEIGIAKTGYVTSDCAWFSDRSACYLASGRPVVASDTGFSRHLPTGCGLLVFRDADEAAAGIEAVRRDYGRHGRAAREIAESHLEAGRVLTRLLGAVGVA